MPTPTVLISAAVLSLLRKEVTPRCIADRFGVTEAQVHEWIDIFTVGGILALSEMNEGGAALRGRGAALGGNTGVSPQYHPESCGRPPGDPCSVGGRISGGGDPTTPGPTTRASRHRRKN